MATNDKTVQKDGAVVYLAGRNWILNSQNPTWEIYDADKSARADVSMVDDAIVATSA